MKTILLIITLLMISACTPQRTHVVKVEGLDRSIVDKSDSFLMVCLNGITYYRGYRFLAPAYSFDGELIPCALNKNVR